MFQEFALPAFSASKTAVALTAVALLMFLDFMGRSKKRHWHLAFAALLGTFLAVGFIEFTQLLFTTRAFVESAYAMAFGVLLLTIGWRLLFGQWEAETKATVLGICLFWIIFRMVESETPAERTGHLIAMGVAAIPAAVWCVLFLSYHRERVSVVLLSFFAGMLATVPILFYDALVRHSVQLQFFVFRVVPESFSSTSRSFVHGQLAAGNSIQQTLVALFLSFVFVGLIEEGSKYWVITRGGSRFFRSIDDVMQLSIIAAIGFAFAENITRSGYFVNFVREYLLDPETRDWAGFLGNVTGRAILTNMVHIVSTGIMGYFVGLAFFAAPHLREAQARGRKYRVLQYVHGLFGFAETSIYRLEMFCIGIVSAIMLHATCNFLVTLPDALPGNPRTLGELFGFADSSPLHFVSIVLVPSLIYVVGGFLLLTYLFSRKENMKEMGDVVLAPAMAAVAPAA